MKHRPRVFLVWLLAFVGMLLVDMHWMRDGNEQWPVSQAAFFSGVSKSGTRHDCLHVYWAPQNNQFLMKIVTSMLAPKKRLR